MTERFNVELEKAAEGVFRLRMPLPFRLDHINLYLLDGGDHWVLIDTGLNTETTKGIWERLLSSVFSSKPISSIILTHLHPDHIGMASWLQSTCNVPVYLSSADWRLALKLWSVDMEEAADLYASHFAKFGVPPELGAQLVANRAGYKRLVKDLPREVRAISEGQTFVVGDRDWRVLLGRGHSQEHACLWNEAQRVLISGDHVLPDITPNISFLPFGATNPLNDYLASLAEFAELDCDCYLPAHGAVSYNFGERVDAIVHHHHDNFRKILEGTKYPLSVFEAASILFKKDLPAHQMSFALGEAAAHLLYLVGAGSLHLEDQAIWRFEKSGARITTVSDLSHPPCVAVFQGSKVILP